MSEPKIENRPLERKNFNVFGTLREIFPQILVDFPKILVDIFGNRDPLRGKFSIFVILGPFQKGDWFFVTLRPDPLTRTVRESNYRTYSNKYSLSNFFTQTFGNFQKIVSKFE